MRGRVEVTLLGKDERKDGDDGSLECGGKRRLRKGNVPSRGRIKRKKTEQKDEESGSWMWSTRYVDAKSIIQKPTVCQTYKAENKKKFYRSGQWGLGRAMKATKYQ